MTYPYLRAPLTYLYLSIYLSTYLSHHTYLCQDLKDIFLGGWSFFHRTYGKLIVVMYLSLPTLTNLYLSIYLPVSGSERYLFWVGGVSFIVHMICTYLISLPTINVSLSLSIYLSHTSVRIWKISFWVGGVSFIAYIYDMYLVSYSCIMQSLSRE